MESKIKAFIIQGTKLVPFGLDNNSTIKDRGPTLYNCNFDKFFDKNARAIPPPEIKLGDTGASVLHIKPQTKVSSF